MNNSDEVSILKQTEQWLLNPYWLMIGSGITLPSILGITIVIIH